jgi:spherulation-specific family 4 protein
MTAPNQVPLARPARFAVPAYFHPTDHPDDWRALAALGDSLAFAVMNPDSGPATAPDPRYQPAIDAVHAAGGRVIGYVDTAYGQRPAAAVLRDLTAYQSWYGLRGGFLDQVTSGPEHVGYYRRIASVARRLGLDFLAINPGVIPAPGYADLADVVVTFEGPREALRDHNGTARTQPWMRRYPPERFCHLVYSAPAGTLEQVTQEAADRHAAVMYATELTGANPWSRLGGELRSRLAGELRSALASRRSR